MADTGRMKLKVHLNDDGRISEVFVSSATKCRDIVLRLQRHIHHTNCCLVEVWQGCERLVPGDELIHGTLLDWDTDLENVSFYLRPNEDEASALPQRALTGDPEQLQPDFDLRGRIGTNGLHDSVLSSLSNGKLLGGSRLSLDDLQELIARQQQEIASKEQELSIKEDQLQDVKQHTQKQIRSSYITQLQAQVQEQDESMRQFRQLHADIERYKLSNSTLDEELKVTEAQFASKEQELAMAVVKVEGLTQQLEEQRQSWGTREKSKEELELDRLKQELMVRNNLNHHQSVQLQAQKQLLAEKNKELFALDSHVEELTEELRCKKARGIHATTNRQQVNGRVLNRFSDLMDLENELWGNSDSNDWGEEDIQPEYTQSYDDTELQFKTCPGNSRILETLVEEDEPSISNASKSSLDSGCTQSRRCISPQHVKTRVSQLATFFEIAEQDQPTKERKERDNTRLDTSIKVDQSSVLFEGSNCSFRNGSVETMNSLTLAELDDNFSENMMNESERLDGLQPILNQQKERQLSNKTMVPSPLSSPSSLSSLSSFSSSTSTATKSTAFNCLSEWGHDDTNSWSPENSLKTREAKTKGYVTPASVVSEDSSAMFVHASEVPQEPIQQIAIARIADVCDSSTDIRKVQSSLQHLKSSAMSLSDFSKPADNKSHTGNNSLRLMARPVRENERPLKTTRQRTDTALIYNVPKSTRTESTLNSHMVFASPSVNVLLYRKGEEKGTEGDPRESGDGAEFEQSRDSGREHITTEKNEVVFEDSSSPPVIPKRDVIFDKSQNKPLSSSIMIKLSSSRQPSPGVQESLTEPSANNKTRTANTEYKTKSSDTSGHQLHINLSSFGKVMLNDSPVSTNKTVLTEENNLLSSASADKSPGKNVSVLQKSGQRERKKTRHVSLDPHAVLLDSTIEGELEQVKRVIKDVDDPSLANSDGITALHNAVCANHAHVVRFLVEYGCDVNLPDSHGWTPLHCSAANNNLEIVRHLVEHGACVFAATSLEKKTPAQCCDKNTPGYFKCMQYLHDIQQNFGLVNDGKVYALYSYAASEKDELSFDCGEELTVLRRGDRTEKEWWWAENGLGKAGYIPRNLLGMNSRVAPEV